MPPAKRTSVTENKKASVKKKQKLDIDAMAIDEEPAPASSKRSSSKKATTYKERTAAAAAKRRQDKAKEGRWSESVNKSLNDGRTMEQSFVAICKAVSSMASRDLLRKEVAAADMNGMFLPGMAIPALVTVGRSQVDFEDDGHLAGQATGDFDFLESKKAYMTLDQEKRREVFYYAIWRAQAIDKRFFGTWAPRVRALRVAGYMMFQRGTDLAIIADEYSDTE